MSIRVAIENHLVVWVNAQTPKPRVAWENVKFPPTNQPLVDTETYLRAFRMPATRRGLSLCSIEEAGVYQVSIFLAKNSTGAAQAETLAESICDHFKPGQYAGFFVSQPPYYSQGLNTDDGRFMVPVSIFYRAEP